MVKPIFYKATELIFGAFEHHHQPHFSVLNPPSVYPHRFFTNCVLQTKNALSLFTENNFGNVAIDFGINWHYVNSTSMFSILQYQACYPSLKNYSRVS